MKLESAGLHQFLESHSATTPVFIGYSGGIDSHVLLHCLAGIPEIHSKITALHVHHGLQSCADDWVIHCEKVARDLGVKYQTLYVNAQPKKRESPEEAARNVRYQAFKSVLEKEKGGSLLLAQHRQDQVETVLLQLFRGAGLKGLSAMPERAVLGEGYVLRPFLDVTQAEIHQYAKQHNLQWVEDPSNQSSEYDRNYLRHEVLPLLEARWLGLDKAITRSSKHCAEAHESLSLAAKSVLELLYQDNSQCLSVKGLILNKPVMQQWIIREWFVELGLRMPSQKVLKTLLQELVLAGEDANPRIEHDGHLIQRYQGTLYISENQPLELEPVEWQDINSPISLINNGYLSLRSADKGLAVRQLKNNCIEIRYRQGGERIALPFRQGRHSLKKLYQEANIPPWQRASTPLIYINGNLAAIADLWVSAEFYAEGLEPCMKVIWQQSS